MTRLRQVALVAQDLATVAKELEVALDLRGPFRDPGIAEFGLHNVVYALGDTFLEIVSPTRDDTTAGRYLERIGGDGGYMVLVQVDDLAATRARAEHLGVRTVWSIDLDDIAASHLHPKDLGAITSIDQPVDPASWRWGGPDWQGRRSPSRLVGVDVGGSDHNLWSKLLDLPVQDDAITFDDGSVIRFVAGTGVTGIDVVTGADGAALSANFSLFGQVTDGLDTTIKALDALGNPDQAANGVPPLEQIIVESVTITET